jgi:hypothetical protein
MNAHDPSVNCFCHFCGHPLRFQISRLGQAVNCLNCTMETILFIPGLQPPYPEERYALQTSEIRWMQNQFGLRTLSGVISNHSDQYLDWVRVEFILYSGCGMPIGMTSDCIINFTAQSSWTFHAPVSQSEASQVSEPLLSCEYGRITRPAAASPASLATSERPALARTC